MYEGLSLQQEGGSKPTNRCDYLVDLVRDRLVTLLEQSYRPDRSALAGERFSTLLRETRASCSAQDSELSRKIDRISDAFAAYQDRSLGDEKHRLELLEL
ncbi:MAG: hypothetical protein R3B09_28960 [Nannocystaceae bacterium]